MTGVSELTFSANAEQIYSGTVGGTAHIWDLTTSKEVAKLQGHITRCTCLNSDMMGQGILVTGSEDTRVKVWDVR
jgi:WD40 repeat protein